MIIVAGMLLTVMPYVGYQNVNAKTTTTKCPANKGSKTNKIYLYKSGTKSSKKLKPYEYIKQSSFILKVWGKQKNQVEKLKEKSRKSF